MIKQTHIFGFFIKKIVKIISTYFLKIIFYFYKLFSYKNGKTML